MEICKEEGRLNIQYYRQFSHSLDQLGVCHLSVNDSKRQSVILFSLSHAVLAALFKSILDGSQNYIEAFVSYTVDGRLKTHLVSFEHPFIQVFLADYKNSVSGRIIVVRLKQFSGSGA